MSQSKQADFDIEIIDNSIIEVGEDDITIASDVEIVEVPSSEVVEVSEEETFKPIEYSEWTTPSDFEQYIVASARNVPPVFSDSKNSFRRAFSYLEKLSEEMIDGVQQDAPYANLNEEQLRTFDTIEEGIDSALQQISAVAQGRVKTATKSSGFSHYINPFIHSLARVLINGKVSQGKNIEELYATLNQKYALNDREQLELYYALEDFGHPIAGSFVNYVDRAEQYQT